MVILEVQERASQTGEGRGERLAKLVCVVSAMPPLGRNPLSIYHLIILVEGEELKEMMGTAEFVAPELIDFDRIELYTDMW